MLNYWRFYINLFSRLLSSKAGKVEFEAVFPTKLRSGRRFAASQPTLVSLDTSAYHRLRQAARRSTTPHSCACQPLLLPHARLRRIFETLCSCHFTGSLQRGRPRAGAEINLICRGWQSSFGNISVRNFTLLLNPRELFEKC